MQTLHNLSIKQECEDGMIAQPHAGRRTPLSREAMS